MEVIIRNKIISVNIIDDLLILLTDEGEFQFEIKNISQALLKASEIERNTFSISPSGYGIHWPLIDEDLSLSGLMKVLNK
jgi:hypothetical protein